MQGAAPAPLQYFLFQCSSLAQGLLTRDGDESIQLRIQSRDAFKTRRRKLNW